MGELWMMQHTAPMTAEQECIFTYLWAGTGVMPWGCIVMGILSVTVCVALIVWSYLGWALARKKIEDYLWIKGKDGSLTWQARRRILGWAFVLGVIAAVIFGTLANCFLPCAGKMFADNKVFASALALGALGIIFGLGNWLIKNDDVQKQFRDTFEQRNDLLFSNTVKFLFEKDNPVATIYGLKELSRLRNKESLYEAERIDGVTSSGINLIKVKSISHNFSNMNLQSANIQNSIFIYSHFDKVDFKMSRFYNSIFILPRNFRDVTFYKTWMVDTLFSGFFYDEDRYLFQNPTENMDAGWELPAADKKCLDNFLSPEIDLTDTVYFNNIRFHGLTLSRVCFRHVIFKNVKFINCVLDDVHFQSVRLLNVNFNGVKFEGTVKFSNNCSYDSKTQFPQDYPPEAYGLTEFRD